MWFLHSVTLSCVLCCCQLQLVAASCTFWSVKWVLSTACTRFHCDSFSNSSTSLSASRLSHIYAALGLPLRHGWNASYKCPLLTHLFIYSFLSNLSACLHYNIMDVSMWWTLVDTSVSKYIFPAECICCIRLAFKLQFVSRSIESVDYSKVIITAFSIQL